MNHHRHHLRTCTLILSTGLFLIGCNNSEKNDTPLDDPDSNLNPPTAPSELTGKVYSKNAIELSWIAATDNGTVVEYQVFRDDSLVATQSTLHFFEDSLTAGSTHSYRVLAVDDEGHAGASARIELTTLDEGPAIGEANYAVVLPHVIDIANGGLFDELRAIVDATDVAAHTEGSYDDVAGITLVDQGVDPENDRMDFYAYDCDSGGSYRYYNDNWIQFGGYYKGEYTSCQIDGNTLSGDFNRRSSLDKAPPYGRTLNSWYNLTVQSDALGSQRQLIGRLIVDNTQVDNRFSFTEASYLEQNLLWSTSITDIVVEVYATDEEQLQHYETPFSRTFDAGFRIQGPHTGDQWLTATIAFTASDQSNPDYQSGSLTVTAEDGSSMHMTADNGDPETFQLTFSQADSSTALTLPWTDEYRLKCFQEPTFDARFADCN